MRLLFYHSDQCKLLSSISWSVFAIFNLKARNVSSFAVLSKKRDIKHFLDIKQTFIN